MKGSFSLSWQLIYNWYKKLHKLCSCSCIAADPKSPLSCLTLFKLIRVLTCLVTAAICNSAWGKSFCWYSILYCSMIFCSTLQHTLHQGFMFGFLELGYFHSKSQFCFESRQNKGRAYQIRSPLRCLYNCPFCDTVIFPPS